VLVEGLELYSSYARGLEEAGVAPGTASNRNEILDAILVTQRELGLRWIPKGGPTVILAGFDTRKPYAGIDPSTNRYRFLGNVTHRGVEASVSGNIGPGVRIVLGGVWLDPTLRIEGEQADGPVLRPVAVPRLRAVAGIDVAVPWLDGVNLDAALTHAGRRAVRSSPRPDGSQLEVRALTTLDLGARYAFTLGGQEFVLRAQILNVANSYAWDVNVSETLAYNEPRRARLLLTVRF
jgi:iron complex outermembrane receptor protein